MSVVESVERLSLAPIEQLDRAALGAALDDVRMITGFVESVRLRIVGRLDSLASAGDAGPALPVVGHAEHQFPPRCPACDPGVDGVLDREIRVLRWVRRAAAPEFCTSASWKSRPWMPHWVK